MNQIIYIPKTQIPELLFELGKNSMFFTMETSIVISFISIVAFICVVYEGLWVTERKVNYPILLTSLVITFGGLLFPIFHKPALNYNFNQFAKSDTREFVIQSMTAINNKEYKFVAETKNGYFIKEVKHEK